MGLDSMFMDCRIMADDKDALIVHARTEHQHAASRETTAVVQVCMT